jgi:hypothetical protein
MKTQSHKADQRKADHETGFFFILFSFNELSSTGLIQIKFITM